MVAITYNEWVSLAMLDNGQWFLCEMWTAVNCETFLIDESHPDCLATASAF